MTRQFTYGRQERLKSRKCIEQLFKEGRSFALPPFRVYWLLHPPAPVVKDGVAVPEAKGTGAAPSRSAQAHSAQVAPAPPSHPAKASFPALQCGVGVSSRQFRKAVDRNRIKRLTREAWRLQKKPLADAMAARPEQLALFFIYTSKELPAFDLVKEKMAIAIRKLATILQETQRGNEKGPLHT